MFTSALMHSESKGSADDSNQVQMRRGEKRTQSAGLYQLLMHMNPPAPEKALCQKRQGHDLRPVLSQPEMIRDKGMSGGSMHIHKQASGALEPITASNVSVHCLEEGVLKDDDVHNK